MIPSRRRLLFLGLMLAGLSLSVGLTLLALRSNLSWYRTPSELAAHPPASSLGAARRLRVGGLVEEGSLRRDPASARITFRITDRRASVPARFDGLPPDLFREGQGVVAEGRWLEERPGERVFAADRLLVKHDETYRPPTAGGTVLPRFR